MESACVCVALYGGLKVGVGLLVSRRTAMPPVPSVPSSLPPSPVPSRSLTFLSQDITSLTPSTIFLPLFLFPLLSNRNQVRGEGRVRGGGGEGEGEGMRIRKMSCSICSTTIIHPLSHLYNNF